MQQLGDAFSGLILGLITWAIVASILAIFGIWKIIELLDMVVSHIHFY
jgi:hypothetical protein